MKKIKIIRWLLVPAVFIFATIAALNIENYAEIAGLNKLWVWGLNMLSSLLSNNYYWFAFGFVVSAAVISWVFYYLYVTNFFVNKNTFIDVIVENGALKTLQPPNKSNIYKMDCMHAYLDSPNKAPATLALFVFEKPIYKAGFAVKPKGNYETIPTTEGIRDTKYFIMQFYELHKHNGRTFEIRFN